MVQATLGEPPKGRKERGYQMFNYTSAKAIQEEKRRELSRSFNHAKTGSVVFRRLINAFQSAFKGITAATRKLLPGPSKSSTATVRRPHAG